MVANTPTALWAEIPEHLRGGLARWLIHGLPPGSFLSSAIAGDLFAAAARADDVSLAGLGYVARFLDIFAPADAKGAVSKRFWGIFSHQTRDLELRLSFENYPEFIEFLTKESEL